MFKALQTNSVKHHQYKCIENQTFAKAELGRNHEKSSISIIHQKMNRGGAAGGGDHSSFSDPGFEGEGGGHYPKEVEPLIPKFAHVSVYSHLKMVRGSGSKGVSV